MDAVRITLYLNEKYDGMFRRHTKSNAYNRLWLFYKELNINIDIEYVSRPKYGEILLPYTKTKIAFITNKLKMVEDNSLWSCYGQRFVEGSKNDYHFGRLVMLLMGHYGLSLGEIKDICHIEDPKECLLKWVRHCINKGWCCSKRVELTPKDALDIRMADYDFSPRRSLEVFLMESFGVRSNIACMFLDGYRVKSIVEEGLSIPAKIFYDIEYLKEDPEEYDFNSDMWGIVYKDAIEYISQKMLENPTSV